jgi:hypothetical protein
MNSEDELARLLKRSTFITVNNAVVSALRAGAFGAKYTVSDLVGEYGWTYHEYYEALYENYLPE